MAKGDQQQQQQTQSSKTDPWAPAQPLLKKLLGEYGGLDTSVTGDQSSAVGSLMDAATGIPSFGGAGADAVSKMFGYSTQPQVGMLKDAFGGLNTNIGATARGENLDPYKTPGFGDALATTMNDITNRVKGVYAGSGRDPSGAGSFAKSLGRGLTEGVAPTIMNEADRLRGEQTGAAKTLYDAGGGTAGAITGQQGAEFGAGTQGFNMAGMLSKLFTDPASTQLAAANTGYGMPFSNLAQMLSPVAQIAGLGGQSSGTSNATTTQMQSPMSNVLGGISGGIGLLSFLSDVEAKEDIEPVGKLDDGQTVYKYRYKGDDPRVHIGLIAQEVASHEPDAVERHPGGMLMVNYDKATQRAAITRRAA